eukprot:2234202-Rhodomonas_salina.2
MMLLQMMTMMMMLASDSAAAAAAASDADTAACAQEFHWLAGLDVRTKEKLLVCSPIRLRACYAVPGTDSVGCYAIRLRACYAVPGTDAASGGTPHSRTYGIVLSAYTVANAVPSTDAAEGAPLSA